MNIMYFKRINKIGGVETFIYTLAKKYDFTFYYKEADPEQIKRFAKYIKVRKYKGQKINCNKAFWNYNPDIIDNVEAKEHIGMIHCDYKSVSFKPITHPKITKYIGVSKYVCETFKELTGIDAEVCYNPIDIESPNVKKKTDKIHIVYAGRLTSEKGGWRIDKLSEIYDKSGIDYDLTILTNKKVQFKSKNIIVKEPKLDIRKEMQEATFILITSDGEAFCLSAIEGLILGTPLITTPLPVFKELGIDDTNSITIDFDLKEVNPNDLLKKFNFKYKPPKDNWNKYLSTDKTYNPKDLVEVKILKWILNDSYEKKKYRRNEIYKTTQERASYLEALGYVEIME